MLAVYIMLGVVGGGLILLSAIGGLGEGHHIPHDLHDSGDVWLPFLSLRFWIYGGACFGLIGVLGTLFSVSREPTIALVAGVSGIVMGTIAAWAYRALSKTEVHGGVGANDLLGAMGKVMVAVGSDKTGRVRLLVKGDTIDMLALTEGARIEVGEEIVVTGVEKDRATVARKGEILGD